jgi:oxygen-independent coproporphyrinogen-3 oxidase
MGIDALEKRYGEAALMYTEYPHKKFWRKSPSQGEYKKSLLTLLNKKENSSALLYVHIPFCHKQCLFCTCHVIIEKNYSSIIKYMDYLHKEVSLIKSFIDENNTKLNISEIHLGGGSPTYLKTTEFDSLINLLSTICDLKKLKEFSIEIDPRRIDEERIEYYATKGISRISFGIQDFDIKVQTAVARVQPAKLTEKLISENLRGLFKGGINFDLLIGLPFQTIDTFKATIKEVIRLNPDRICMNYMHLSTKFHPHQLKMPLDTLPSFSEKKLMFTIATDMLDKHGYERTGYDHFAKLTDKMTQAKKMGTMSWNRLGVNPGNYTSCIGLGVSSTGTIGDDYYYQNAFDLDEYYTALDKNEIPLENSIKLSSEDILRRTIIHNFRNYFEVDKRLISQQFDIDFEKHFEEELSNLQKYEDDELLRISNSDIKITEIGQQFANLIASTFDTYINQPVK